MAKTATDKKTSKRRSYQSELHSDFDGLLTMANKEKLANVLSKNLNCTADEARTRIRSVISRIGKGNGIVAKRSETMINQILDAVVELRPNMEDLANDLRSKITYRNTKTGKRGASWINNLLAGVPRKQEDGSFKMFMTVTADEAKTRCEELGVDFATVNTTEVAE